jgi:hypothetical protein
MQKILIMVFALALNSGLNLQASGEPVKQKSLSKEDIAKHFKARMMRLQMNPKKVEECLVNGLKENLAKLDEDAFFAGSLKCANPKCAVYETLYICKKVGCDGAALYCNSDCQSEDWRRHMQDEGCFNLVPDAK